jgi:hypothetical protein
MGTSADKSGSTAAVSNTTTEFRIIAPSESGAADVIGSPDDEDDELWRK